MAIIRQRRAAAIQGKYNQAAFFYLLVGAIVFGTSQLSGMQPPGQPADETLLMRMAPLIFLLIATLVIWRGMRFLCLLLMLLSLFQAAFHLMDGLGKHYLVKAAETAPAANQLTDVAKVQSFVAAELATNTPFFESLDFERTDILIREAFSSLPIPESVLESLGNLAISSAYMSFFNAALLVLATLMIWRAARLGSPRHE
jgi:hypothetical protein